jgi:hypothetical protein
VAGATGGGVGAPAGSLADSLAGGVLETRVASSTSSTRRLPTLVDRSWAPGATSNSAWPDEPSMARTLRGGRALAMGLAMVKRTTTRSSSRMMSQSVPAGSSKTMRPKPGWVLVRTAMLAGAAGAESVAGTAAAGAGDLRTALAAAAS